MVVEVRQTPRGRDRRERILQSAAGLVASRGFHSVGVSEIGAAAGVSGAALYRHFQNKSDILIALLDRVVDQLLLGSAAATDSQASASETLQTLIRAHVDFAIDNRTILAVYAQESPHLPESDRRRLRAKQRKYVDEWCRVYRQIGPGISEATARVRVEAVFGLINSAPNVSHDISDRMIRSEFRRLAELALLGRT